MSTPVRPRSIPESDGGRQEADAAASSNGHQYRSPPDHTTGNFVFSPPALVINHADASEAIRKAYDPERASALSKQSPEMRDAVQGYRLVTPHIEYHDKTTLRVGERTLELLHLKNVHSEADTAVWLPSERVLFASSVAIPNSIIPPAFRRQSDMIPRSKDNL